MVQNDISEADIRAALTRSGNRMIPPSGWADSLDGLLSRRSSSTVAARAPWRGWLVPAAIAGVTAAVVSGVWMTTRPVHETLPPATPAAPGALHLEGSRAYLDGMSFPVPAGWSVIGPTITDVHVEVCVSHAALPDTACDGITITEAVVDDRGDFTPVPGPLGEVDGCRWIMLLAQDAVAGRPADHYSTACSADGPTSLSWYLTDGSLLISTPPGRYAQQAEQLVNGLDLTKWTLVAGVPVVENTGILPTP